MRLNAKRLLIASAAILFASSITYLAVGDVLAELLLRRYELKFPALFLIQDNEEIAFEIGSLYFNEKISIPILAKLAFYKALTANPQKQFAHYQLARIYFVEGKYETALLEINEELRLFPENLRSLYVRGLIYGYQGNLDAAEADFARFVVWAPKEWAGYNDLAWIQLKAMRPERARGTLKNAFQVVPEAETNPWLLNSLGVAEMNLGNRGAAFIAFEKAKTLADVMTEEEWASAYPGNNPKSQKGGFEAFRKAIVKNLEQITAVDNGY